jgi:hypothetical protein
VLDPYYEVSVYYEVFDISHPRLHSRQI